MAISPEIEAANPEVVEALRTAAPEGVQHEAGIPAQHGNAPGGARYVHGARDYMTGDVAMTSDQNNTLVTVQQFAALHGVSPVTVRLWISTGRLPGAQKLGRDWIIPASAQRPPDGRVTRWSRST